MKKRRGYRGRSSALLVLWIVSLIIVAIILYSAADFSKDLAGKAFTVTDVAEIVPCPPEAECEGYIVELEEPAVLENAEVVAIKEEIAQIGSGIAETGDLAGHAADTLAAEQQIQVLEAELNEVAEAVKLEIVEGQQDAIEQIEQTTTVVAGEIKSVADTVINAVVLEETVTEQEIKEVAKLPEVKKIWPNVKVHALEDVETRIFVQNGIDASPFVLSSDGAVIGGENAQQFIVTEDGIERVGSIEEEQIDVLTSGDPVDALLHESVDLIGASSPGGAWDQGYTGQGVAIGIIDTGVDYTHPDLGGCFGQGCKVVGGYDFVNNDHDPIDDHGHGTHVAATAAGKGDYNGDNVRDAGEFWGVAPDAKIMAYKVLDASGSGTMAGVIAGINRAVSDHADIISLSLGGPGDPDDLVSRAIDNAVDNG
ncbi:MAG TPA: S8 family serine peptidase, partial [Candidatus Nanoarchaeia archaeon]|nr:S8 family serine peptidase [Candidatus Nanoarchaeia archaeon]